MEQIEDENLYLEYTENYYSSSEADSIFKILKEYPFRSITFNIRNRRITPKRKVCAYGDNSSAYSFSGISIAAEPWTGLLREMKLKLEEKTGYVYNFALLNLYEDGTAKISPHTDDEQCLDVDVPIATLSFGARRNILFSRPGNRTHKIALNHASLLVRNYPTNHYWKHAIDAEPETNEMRISITFRKIISVNKKEDESQCSPKRLCVGDTCSDETVDNFFINVDPNRIPTNSFEKEIFETVVKKYLKYDLYITAALNNGEIKVNIKEHPQDNSGLPLSSKASVTMDLLTWYDFVNKLFDFNLIYSTSCYIANKQICVLNDEDESMIIHPLHSYNPLSVKLNREQLEKLKEVIHDFNENIKNYLICTRLPYFIEKECIILTDETNSDNDSSLAKLIIHIENNLCGIFKELYECNGCIINHPSQRQHQCMTASDSEKYASFDEDIFLLLNVKEIASKFANDVKYIKRDFSELLSLKFIRDVVFKTH